MGGCYQCEPCINSFNGGFVVRQHGLDGYNESPTLKIFVNLLDKPFLCNPIRNVLQSILSKSNVYIHNKTLNNFRLITEFQDSI